MTDLRAEHGLAHLVEVTRGTTTTRVLFDFGQTDASLNHNVRELGVELAPLGRLTHDRDAELDRDRHHEAAGVVGVLADQVHPPRREEPSHRATA